MLVSWEIMMLPSPTTFELQQGNAWDCSLAEPKLSESARHILVLCKVSKWYPMTYIHLKESHHDGKAMLAPTTGDQSMAKLLQPSGCSCPTQSNTTQRSVSG
eukprot:TRINITY_DN21687_c0_g4_i1.p1 TRINITY_DN21687_c0_g4~~TRINITY_DN21687_c0_g4_i1.p1  ORF type:complete len:102 (-),score=5.79 TRINITY_DN21687_c0_g4_i1:2595-2900(-)